METLQGTATELEATDPTEQRYLARLASGVRLQGGQQFGRKGRRTGSGNVHVYKHGAH
jgi:hypothetical protein